MFNRMRAGVTRISSGDLSSFDGPKLDEVVAGRVRAEQMSIILQYLPWMMLANASNALILIIAFWSSSIRLWALVWAATVLVYAVAHGLRRRARAARPTTVSARTIRRATRNAFLLGCLWAVLPLFFFAEAPNSGQLIIICLCAGMLGGGAFAFASLPIAAIVFTSPIYLASLFTLAGTGGQAHLLIAALMIVYTWVLLRGVFVHSLKLTSRIVRQCEIETEIRRDALTKLPNRIAFHECLEDALSRLAHSHEQFAVSYLDLDQFKAINDKRGHGVGDELLIQVAERLSLYKREADLLARLSGDEFALILTSVESAEHALALGERVTRAFDSPFAIDGVQLISRASVGIAVAPVHGRDKITLLKNADAALYSAKHDIGGVVQVFNSESAAKARERRALANDLRDALRQDELYLEFQPLLDIHRNSVVGGETLLRWMHPRRGTIAPGDFIQIAEETGLIHPIGEWVLRQACRTAAGWPEDFRVAVNFSTVQFCRASILPMVMNVLTETGLSPCRLEIEITETVLLSEDEVAFATLNALRSLGVRIALDDFGTGYSSLSYLRKLPLDRIKIDGSFVRELLTNAECASIVKSVIGLAEDLGMSTTAEGVETDDELSRLRFMRCTEAQGKVIGMPMSAHKFARLFDRYERTFQIA